MSNSTFSFISSLLPEENIKPNSILSQGVHKDNRIKVTLFQFDKGQGLMEHSSSKPAIIQILKGQAELTLGDKIIEAKEACWLPMPAHLPHSVYAKTELSMLLTIIKKHL